MTKDVFSSFSPEVIERLGDYQKRYGLSKASIIRLAVAKLLEDSEK